jgi:L-asparaginase
MKIKIFSVGGTIDKVYFDSLSEYQVGAPSVRDILAGLPITFEYEIESLMRKDSLDMDDADRWLIREAVETGPLPLHYDHARHRHYDRNGQTPDRHHR